MVDTEHSLPKEILFLQVVSMFQVAAMQQLGKLVDPVSGDIKRDLEQAKISIDILDVLKEKTRGNLTKNEEDFLAKVLFELHMNYVEEIKSPADGGTEAGEEHQAPGEEQDEEQNKKSD